MVKAKEENTKVIRIRKDIYKELVKKQKELEKELGMHISMCEVLSCIVRKAV